MSTAVLQHRYDFAAAAAALTRQLSMRTLVRSPLSLLRMILGYAFTRRTTCAAADDTWQQQVPHCDGSKMSRLRLDEWMNELRVVCSQ
jgi:hypothetical protein